MLLQRQATCIVVLQLLLNPQGTAASGMQGHSHCNTRSRLRTRIVAAQRLQHMAHLLRQAAALVAVLALRSGKCEVQEMNMAKLDLDPMLRWHTLLLIRHPEQMESSGRAAARQRQGSSTAATAQQRPPARLRPVIVAAVCAAVDEHDCGPGVLGHLKAGGRQSKHGRLCTRGMQGRHCLGVFTH